MTHDEIQDLLEGYVDETLDRATRREVDAHLATCDECREILEGVAAVDLGVIEPSSWTPADMRRAVRRSMFRVAVDVVLLVIAATLVAWLVSLTLIHPLIINRERPSRSGHHRHCRSGRHVQSRGERRRNTWYQSHLLSRTSEVTVSMPVGALPREIGSIESTIGPLAFGDANGGMLFPYLSGLEEAIGGQDRLEAVGDGTVATVLMGFETPLDMEAAGELLESDADVRVVWAGFAVGESSGLSSAGVLGYGTCGSPSMELSGAIGASGGGSGGFFGEPASIDDALAETRRAVDNLIDHPDLLEGIGSDLEEADSVLLRTGQPTGGITGSHRAHLGNDRLHRRGGARRCQRARRGLHELVPTRLREVTVMTIYQDIRRNRRWILIGVVLGYGMALAVLVIRLINTGTESGEVLGSIALAASAAIAPSLAWLSLDRRSGLLPAAALASLMTGLVTLVLASRCLRGVVDLDAGMVESTGEGGSIEGAMVVGSGARHVGGGCGLCSLRPPRPGLHRDHGRWHGRGSRSGGAWFPVGLALSGPPTL